MPCPRPRGAPQGLNGRCHLRPAQKVEAVGPKVWNAAAAASSPQPASLRHLRKALRPGLSDRRENKLKRRFNDRSKRIETLAKITRRRRELRGPVVFASRTADDAARMIRALFPNIPMQRQGDLHRTELRHPGFSILSLADALRRRPRRHHRLHPHICAMSPG